MLEAWFPLQCAVIGAVAGGIVGFSQARLFGALIGILVVGLVGLIIGAFLSVVGDGAMNLKPTHMTKALAVGVVVFVAAAIYALWGTRR